MFFFECTEVSGGAAQQSEACVQQGHGGGPGRAAEAAGHDQDLHIQGPLLVGRGTCIIFPSLLFTFFLCPSIVSSMYLLFYLV